MHFSWRDLTWKKGIWENLPNNSWTQCHNPAVCVPDYSTAVWINLSCSIYLRIISSKSSAMKIPWKLSGCAVEVDQYAGKTSGFLLLGGVKPCNSGEFLFLLSSWFADIPCKNYKIKFTRKAIRPVRTKTHRYILGKKSLFPLQNMLSFKFIFQRRFFVVKCIASQGS